MEMAGWTSLPAALGEGQPVSLARWLGLIADRVQGV